MRRRRSPGGADNGRKPKLLKPLPPPQHADAGETAHNPELHIIPTHGDRAQGPLQVVGVDGDLGVVEVDAQGLAPLQGVGRGLG